MAAFAEARYYAAHGGDYALGGVAVIGRATSGLLSPVFARGLTTYDHGRLLAEQLYSVVVHHTAGRADETVLSVQRFHMETRGWADIGYHFFIDGAGRVFEGRPLGYVGAHAGEGRNQGRVGVCVAGNFETGEPAPAQLAALWALLAALDDRFGGLDILLHREVRAEPTDCPGRFLAAEVERFRAGRKSKRP
ncbi:MAG: N-acetylmuramoyl-L-alanine amidase [Planctomycetes bacterium]|nr:N-acetylmuramoyl-L-alanine amidase [Planctomycetota bacterium]